MTAWFMGYYEHTLDVKGRIIVPAKLRDQLDLEVDGEEFVATPAPEGCLFLYPKNEWRRMCESQLQFSKGSPQLRMFQRVWHANAELIALDKQGRILLPERLRKMAQIERDLVIAGCYDRIEVWSSDRWTEAQAAARWNYDAQVQEFLGGVSSPDGPSEGER